MTFMLNILITKKYVLSVKMDTILHGKSQMFCKSSYLYRQIMHIDPKFRLESEGIPVEVCVASLLANPYI